MRITFINDWASVGSDLGWGIALLSVSYMRFPELEYIDIGGFSVVILGVGLRIRIAP